MRAREIAVAHVGTAKVTPGELGEAQGRSAQAGTSQIAEL
jgi:hypothetical protein